MIKMPNQQYCLRWNNHLPNFITVFNSLLNNECLVDVTLAAEGKYLQAHKVVLSACSSYFQELFSVNPCQHPIVILKDVLYQDLKSVIDFMYCGEVSVAEEQLQSILKVAGTLNVKGLVDMPIATVSDKSVPEKRVAESQTACRRKRLKKFSSSRSDSTLSSSLDEVEILGPCHLPVKIEDATSNEEDTFHNGFRNSTENSFEVPASEKNLNYTELQPLTSSFKKSEENLGGISVITGVKKRNRLLIRQPHIINKSEFDGDETGDVDIPSLKRPLGRQYSDPTPRQSLSPTNLSFDENKSDQLTITSSHLIKQISDSVLPLPGEHQEPVHVKEEELEHPPVLNNSQPRSNHCPVLRPGPALGCNFCWNTIDDHGRILRRKTKYHCPECRTNLCIVPCFQEYHNKKDSGDAENELIKAGEKPSSFEVISQPNASSAKS